MITDQRPLRIVQHSSATLTSHLEIFNLILYSTIIIYIYLFNNDLLTQIFGDCLLSDPTVVLNQGLTLW